MKAVNLPDLDLVTGGVVGGVCGDDWNKVDTDRNRVDEDRDQNVVPCEPHHHWE